MGGKSWVIGTNSMTANEFFDTNILIYAFDSSDKAKQQIAKQLIAEAALSARHAFNSSAG